MGGAVPGCSADSSGRRGSCHAELCPVGGGAPPDGVCGRPGTEPLLQWRGRDWAAAPVAGGGAPGGDGGIEVGKALHPLKNETPLTWSRLGYCRKEVAVVAAGGAGPGGWGPAQGWSRGERWGRGSCPGYCRCPSCPAGPFHPPRPETQSVCSAVFWPCLGTAPAAPASFPCLQPAQKAPAGGARRVSICPGSVLTAWLRR